MNQIFKLLIVLVIATLCLPLHAQTQLSPQAEVRVMTMGPSQAELYSAFGHSAFRVTDPVNRLDVVFDYGRFSLRQEGFYWNFARGIMKYQLGLDRYKRFKNRYIYEKRFIYEQVLNLTPEEKQAVFDYLQDNYKEENRQYLYNYVYDNCATKIQDVLQEVLGDKVTFDISYVEEGTTIRDLMDRYCDQQHWGDLAIDLGLGMGVDKVATPKEYLFLPDFVYRSFNNTTITDDNGTRPLVSKVEKFNEVPEEAYTAPFWTPFNVLTALFFIVGFLTNINFKKNKRSKWIDYLFFGFTGLLGFFLLFLWFGTDHISEWNLNLLWALPTHFVVLFFMNKEKYRKRVRAYFKWTSIFAVLLILVWALLPQPIHTSLVPFVLILILRGFYLVHDLRKAG